MNRKLVWIIVALVVLLVVAIGAGLFAFQTLAVQAVPTNTPRVTATRLVLADEKRTPVAVPTIAVPRTDTPTSIPRTPTRVTPGIASPTLTRPPATVPPTALSVDTATALDRMVIPSRNLFEIVPRLRKDSKLLTPMPTAVARTRTVGQRDNFFVSEDMVTGRYRTTPATLQVVSPRAYIWVEEGTTLDAAALKRLADVFDSQIYPTNIKYFGAPNPGLDGDARLHIFIGKLDAGTGGYFSSVDTHPTPFAQYSNQRNIIFINASVLRASEAESQSTLAHEFQHLIHNTQSPANAGWIDEGMAQVASKVNGYQVDSQNTFARAPDTQLNTWAEGREALAHYGASYMFFSYVADRFGPDSLRQIIHAPREGLNAVQTMLNQQANTPTLNDLFADWAIANYVNDLGLSGGKYGHKSEGAFRITREQTISAYPDVRTNRQHEYAATYFALQPTNSDVTIYFTGTTTAKLIEADAHSGKWVWYSNRADLANMTLTRDLDLSRVSGKATLRFWTWYDIEQDYDYGYVEVSTDNGKTWDILPGKTTITTNPNGANYGAGFSGKSGGTGTPQWIQEEMDLSAYAGKRVLLRFEYITDDAYNRPGWAIDDVTIPELGLSDDIETATNTWDAKGFIRSDNVLPQKYVVQVIEQAGTPRIRRITLDAQNRGSYTLAGFGKDVTKATLVIAAFAPTTTELTEYQFAVTPK